MKKLNIFKIAALTAVFAFAGMFANAQNTTGPELPIQGPVVLGDDGGFVKVIDNKGTVKYLQSQNGITMFTNLTPTNAVVTTFQLGGTLTDDTWINSTNKIFALDGIKLVTGDAAVNPVTGEVHTGTPDLGWTLLVRDETTGEIMKMAATELIQSGHSIYVADADQVLYPLSGVLAGIFKNVYVYRNGAKLLAGLDYTITAGVITLNIATAGTGYTTPAAPGAYEPFPIYAGDRIEIHYVK